MEIDIKLRMGYEQRVLFGSYLEALGDTIGFKVSARGWGYLLESKGYIDKSQFDKVGTLVNTCVKEAIICVDFVADDDARAFKGIEIPTTGGIIPFSARYLRAALRAPIYYTPDWWDEEHWYIQMVVEKIDLVTLFYGICQKYKIPIANAKGWSSVGMRAEYAQRFKEAEGKGLKCVLLYCGDHDPDGLRISDTMMKNLHDIKDVRFKDGRTGYDPSDLIIERFGLDYEFIQDNNLVWIDNLITGSGKNLASPSHKNNKMAYVQDYIQNYDKRKCEANALVVIPDAARNLCENAILKYLGDGAGGRFTEKMDVVEKEYSKFLDLTGSRKAIQDAIELTEDYDEYEH